MWTRGRGVKNLIFCGHHKWMGPYVNSYQVRGLTITGATNTVHTQSTALDCTSSAGSWSKISLRSGAQTCVFPLFGSIEVTPKMAALDPPPPPPPASVLF